MLDLFLILVCVVIVLATIGALNPLPTVPTEPKWDYNPVTAQLLPDLRISEFAPDLDTALNLQPIYKLKKKEREKAEIEIAYKRNMEELEERRILRLKRQAEHDKQMWEWYHEQLTEAKLKRWLEGNPVTRENPLKEHETPPKPHTYGGF